MLIVTNCDEKDVSLRFVSLSYYLSSTLQSYTIISNTLIKTRKIALLSIKYSQKKTNGRHFSTSAGIIALSGIQNAPDFPTQHPPCRIAHGLMAYNIYQLRATSTAPFCSRLTGSGRRCKNFAGCRRNDSNRRDWHKTQRAAKPDAACCNRQRSALQRAMQRTATGNAAHCTNRAKTEGWHSERNASLASSLFLWPRKKFRLKEKLLT